MPIEIVAIKRPQPAAQPDAAAAEPVDKKSGSQREENLKKQLRRSELLQNSESAAVVPTTDAPQAKKQIKSAQPKTASRLSQNATTSIQYQSLAVFAGRLSSEAGKLEFVCPDETVLPIIGIDQKLALWLMSHPTELYSSEIANWLVYPRADFRTKQLVIQLRGKLNPDKPFRLAPDQAVVKGKLLAVDEGKLTIGIRRNIPSEIYKELQRKNMIRGSEFEQFIIQVNGNVDAEVKAMVELNCCREKDRLVVVNDVVEPS